MISPIIPTSYELKYIRKQIYCTVLTSFFTLLAPFDQRCNKHPAHACIVPTCTHISYPAVVCGVCAQASFHRTQLQGNQDLIYITVSCFSQQSAHMAPVSVFCKCLDVPLDGNCFPYKSLKTDSANLVLEPSPLSPSKPGDCE